MDCNHFEDLFSLYLEDELSFKERESVDLHLNSCPECRELLALIRETNEALSLFPEIEISPQLKRKLYKIPAQKKRFSFRHVPKRNFLR